MATEQCYCSGGNLQQNIFHLELKIIHYLNLMIFICSQNRLFRRQNTGRIYNELSGMTN